MQEMDGCQTYLMLQSLLFIFVKWHGISPLLVNAKMVMGIERRRDEQGG